MGAPGWPARLAAGPVGLRPLRWRDAYAWQEVRQANEAWLRPWEATPPGTEVAPIEGLATFLAMRANLHRRARSGDTLPFAVTFDGRLVGQVTVANVIRGSANSASVGYWIDERYAGRGIIPTALALVTDHCFTAAGLHRLEANIRPENEPSLQVVRKLGFREEGLRRRFLHIDGAYRDHLCYALTVEDVPGGLLARWRSLPRHTGAGP